MSPARLLAQLWAQTWEIYPVRAWKTPWMESTQFFWALVPHLDCPNGEKGFPDTQNPFFRFTLDWHRQKWCAKNADLGEKGLFSYKYVSEEVFSIRGGNNSGQPWVWMKTFSWGADWLNIIPSLPWPHSCYKWISAAFSFPVKNKKINNISVHPQTREEVKFHWSVTVLTWTLNNCRYSHN